MKRYAVIAAADEYVHAVSTPFCHSDATLLKEALTGFCDFAEQDIILHLLSPKTDMSPSELLTSIESVADRMQRGDTIVFYYAGHGAVDKDEPYLVLPNTDLSNLSQTALPLRDVSARLRKPEYVNVRIFDVCHSGYDVRDASESVDEQAFLRAITTEQAAGWLTFAACRSDEFSHSDIALQHGVFTYYLHDVLRSFPEDTDVLPELLKIEVCKRVASWCQDTQHVQTPTLNAAISGNLVMARTKKKLPQITQDSSAELIPTIDVRSREAVILERLNHVRSPLKPGTKEYWAKLEEYVNHIKNAIESNLGSIQSFGCQVSVTSALSASQIYKAFKKPIAQFVDQRQLRTFHNIRVVEERQNLGGILSVATGIVGPSVTYEYEVGQDYTWPNSFIRMDIDTDGFLPSAGMFFYVIPLQIRVCVLRGIGTSSLPTTSIDTFESGSLAQLFVDLNGADTFAKIDTFVKTSLSVFGELFSKQVEVRLDYLESEKKR